jgi:hypothetical protein
MEERFQGSGVGGRGYFSKKFIKAFSILSTVTNILHYH